jgi:adenine specific DNA methylase Mod
MQKPYQTIPQRSYHDPKRFPNVSKTIPKTVPNDPKAIPNRSKPVQKRVQHDPKNGSKYPTSDSKPIPNGVNAFRNYPKNGTIRLQIYTKRFLFFSKRCQNGSTRCKPIPRGSETVSLYNRQPCYSVSQIKVSRQYSGFVVRQMTICVIR